MATDPWAVFNPQAMPAGDPVIAPADPYKQAGEQRAQQDQAMQAEAAERARLQWEATHNPDGTPKATAGADDQKSAQKLANLEALVTQLNRVQQLYNESLKGRSVLEYLPTPEMREFDAAAAGLAEQGLAAFRVPGVGAQSDTELRQFVEANKPSSLAYDETNLERLRQLRSRVDETRAALGLPPAEWSGLTDDEAAKEGLERKRDDAPPSGGNPPTDGGGGSFTLGGVTQRLGEGAGSMVEGVGDLLGIVVNPFGQAMYDALGYDQRYDTGTILREATGLPDNPIQANDAIIKGGTAALTGSLAARGAASLANPGVTQNVLATIGRTPVRDAAAGAGAGAGMVAGQASGIPGGEVAGALVGGLAGYGGASGVNALANMARGGQPNALAQAAARQGVDLLPAEAGGPVARAMTTGAKASPVSVAPVVNAAQRSQGQLRTAANRAATSQGEVVSTEAAGKGVRAAAERFTQQTSQRASRLYDRANEAAKGVLVKPLQTVARLDEHIARLRNDPSAPESAVAELTRFRERIAGGVSVSGLRDARSRLSQGVYDGKLRSGSEQAMWKDILGNLSNDIEAGLQNAGRGEAAGMFKRADAFWRERVEHIDQVLQPILGKDRGGEQIVQAVESMARGQSGGNTRLSRLLAEMTPEEAGQLRAVVIDRIGRANPGAQDAEGTAFSAATFLTNWNKMTPQAKASLFGDKGLRRDLDDIATLAEGTKAGQSMTNYSNTGLAIGSNAALAGAAFMAHPVLTLFGAGAQYLTGRLLASPGFARLLARSAKMPPEAASRTFGEQVGILAAREPLIANDARALQQYLAEAFSQSPSRLAAREQEGDGRPKPPQ